MRPHVMLLLALALTGCQKEPAASPAPPPPAAPKPGWEFTPEDFGVGHKTVKNAWCNRQIDALREQTRQCFNTHPAAECQALQKKNADKIGTYIRSPRCAK